MTKTQQEIMAQIAERGQIGIETWSTWSYSKRRSVSHGERRWSAAMALVEQGILSRVGTQSFRLATKA